RDRHAKRHTHSGRQATERALPWTGVADRRRARHRSKLSHVSGNRASLALRLVALSCQPSLESLSLGAEDEEIAQRSQQISDARAQQNLGVHGATTAPSALSLSMFLATPLSHRRRCEGRGGGH